MTIGPVVILQLVTLAVLAWMGWGLMLIGKLLSAHTKQVRKHIERSEAESGDGC